MPPPLASCLRAAGRLGDQPLQGNLDKKMQGRQSLHLLHYPAYFEHLWKSFAIASIMLGQHRTIWQEHSAKDFASYENYKRAGILYVFPPFITARMGQKIGRRPQTQLCGDALDVRRLFPRQSQIRGLGTFFHHMEHSIPSNFRCLAPCTTFAPPGLTFEQCLCRGKRAQCRNLHTHPCPSMRRWNNIWQHCTCRQRGNRAWQQKT